MSRSTQSLASGRAEPAPPRKERSKVGWPSGEGPGGEVEGGFLGGTHSVGPQRRAGSEPGHVIPTGCVGEWSGA